MFLHVEEVVVVGPFDLAVKFNTGEWRRVELESSLVGPVFEPLRIKEEFDRVYVSVETGTIEWPNGADFAPEYLFEIGTVLESSDPGLVEVPA